MDHAASTSDPVHDDPDAARLARFARAGPASNDAEEAFADLVESAGPALFAFVARFLGHPQDAEEVYQDVWLNVARHAERFDGRARFATWLYRIARNACVDALRRRRRGNPARTTTGKNDDVPVEELPGPDADPARLAEAGERRDRILRRVAELPEAQREVFLLREEAGLSFEEIGTMLGCGRETAKSRMRYALERLRQALGAEARAEGWR